MKVSMNWTDYLNGVMQTLDILKVKIIFPVLKNIKSFDWS